MKLILSTSNLIGGSSIVNHNGSSKSNQELVSGLRSNFEAHLTSTSTLPNGTIEQTEATDQTGSGRNYKRWTRQDTKMDTMEVPQLDFADSALEEEREQYDITLKLFFLPSSNPKDRHLQIEEALQLVLKELHMPSVSLLIVSFPGVYFDEGDDSPERAATREPVESTPEALQEQILTWRALERVHQEGLIERLGVAEFGHDRLEAFLSFVKVRPSVNQINLRDCCSVPKDLLALAKSNKIELLVHNDCSNILPRGTLRELLGPSGAAVLAETVESGPKKEARDGEIHVEAGIPGEVSPQWVVKYTAVVRNRGVVENKGYFAAAEVVE